MVSRPMTRSVFTCFYASPGTQTFQPYQAAALVAEEGRALRQQREEIKKHQET